MNNLLEMIASYLATVAPSSRIVEEILGFFVVSIMLVYNEISNRRIEN